MSLCECGCGAATAKGSFLPGHDQRLRTSLEIEVGGVLPLRSLLQAARSYYEGSISEQALAQVVRSVFYEAGLTGPEERGSATCRDEVLSAARQVMQSSNRDHFTIPEVISHMRRNGTRYANSTIRTHIVSRMCANAPENHAVTYRDLERTNRGEYKVLWSSLIYDA